MTASHTLGGAALAGLSSGIVEGDLTSTAAVTMALDGRRRHFPHVITTTDATLGVAPSGFGVVISATADAALALAPTPVSNVTMTAVATAGVETRTRLYPALTQAILAGDAVMVSTSLLLADAADASLVSLGVVRKSEHLIETMLALGVVDSVKRAEAALVEALVVEDAIANGWGVSLASSGGSTALVEARTRMQFALVSGATAAFTATPILRLTAVLSEEAEAALELASQATLLADLADAFTGTLTLAFGDAEYTCWVMSPTKDANGNPLYGFVEWRNVAFDAAVRFDDRYYFANEHGLFEFTGDTDNGEDIDAWVRSALNNLGTGKLKRLPSVYLGVRTDETVVLKVVTTSDTGAKTQDWYELRRKPGTAMRDARIKVGRGLSSVYWAWELHNVDGGEIELDVVELMPIVLERRIRGA